MMLRTVWSEKLVLPDIGLAAQEATHPCRAPEAAEAAAVARAGDAAAAGTMAAAPRTSAAPPRMAASRLVPALTDDSDFTFSSFVESFGLPA